MKTEYIIVQAGGKGTRMKYLTKNKPKALVPVDNLPIIFYLFRKYPDKKFIVIADYKKEVMENYLASFAEVQFIIVDGKGQEGTCGGLRKSLEIIPAKEAFMLIWCDLILSEEFVVPEKTADYIGLSQDFPCRWRYEKGKFEEESSATCGVAGLFLFKDKSELLNVPKEGEFVRWLSENDFQFNVIPLNKTKECGVLSEYDKLTGSQNIRWRCRPFNKLEIVDGKVIKTGINQQGKDLAVREKNWYKKVSENIMGSELAIPQIYSYEPLTLQQINGLNVFEYELSEEEQKRTLQKLVRAVKKIHEIGSVATDYFSIKEAYLTKTFARLEKIRDLVPFAQDEYIVINGKPCRNVFFYKEEITRLFEDYACARFEFLHGDITFSNILLDEDMNPVIIDPRGYFGYTELYGDPNYDWAKLYYSIVGNYDQFNLRHFRLSVNEKDVELDIQSNGWEKMEDYYFELLGSDVEKDAIRLIHAIIWLSLTTYAWEDYDSICGAFYNGLTYLEDILVKHLDGVEKENAIQVNLTFDDTMQTLTNALRTVDEKSYNQLLDECEQTIRNGSKIITSGLGKNVPVCDKFTGTMLSLGLDASFLHTNSAVHGDLGMVKKGDLVIILTKSGATSESVYLVEQLLKRDDVNIWLITFNYHSILGEKLKSLVIELEHEGDLWNIIPNNSTTLNMIVLQSIAMNLADRLKLSLEQDFKPNHPGGAIGRQLQ